MYWKNARRDTDDLVDGILAQRPTLFRLFSRTLDTSDRRHESRPIPYFPAAQVCRLDCRKAYGDRGDDEFIQQSVTIPQRLLVMNGSYVSERIKNNPVMNVSTHIAQLASDDRVAVETAYLSTLNRLPTGAELDAFCERLHGTKRNARSQAMSSIFWALINCTEFQWNH